MLILIKGLINLFFPSILVLILTVHFDKFPNQNLRYVYFSFHSFLGPHMWHMEVPRTGLESELQLPAYTIDQQLGIQATSATNTSLPPIPQLTATPDPSPTEQGPGIKPASSWILARFLTHGVTTGTP